MDLEPISSLLGMAGFVATMIVATYLRERWNLASFHGTLYRDRARYNWIFSWMLTFSFGLTEWELISTHYWALILSASIGTIVLHTLSRRHLKKRLTNGVLRWRPNDHTPNLKLVVPVIAGVLLVFHFSVDAPFPNAVMLGIILAWPVCTTLEWIYVRRLERQLGTDIVEARGEAQA